MLKYYWPKQQSKQEKKAQYMYTVQKKTARGKDEQCTVGKNCGKEHSALLEKQGKEADRTVGKTGGKETRTLLYCTTTVGREPTAQLEKRNKARDKGVHCTAH